MTRITDKLGVWVKSPCPYSYLGCREVVTLFIPATAGAFKQGACPCCKRPVYASKYESVVREGSIKVPGVV